MPLEWREFRIGELFEVGTGSLLVSQNLKQGSIPRISAKSDNNGILGYFDTGFNSEARHCENFISVNFFGDAFYHPYKASLEMKVHTLKLKNGTFTKSSGLFIAGIIRKNFYGKFTYGNQLSSSKLKNEDFRILLPVLPTQANSVRHCEAFKPKQSTQNDEQIACHEKSSDFSRNDKNTKSHTLQDSKICDEKSGLYEVGQGSYLPGNDRRHTEAIADLSRKAKSHALAFDLPCLLPVLDSGRQDFGDKNGALRDEARELPKVVMTEAEAKQSPFLAQKPTPTINFDFMQSFIKALEKESIKNVVLYQQRLKAAYEKVLKR